MSDRKSPTITEVDAFTERLDARVDECRAEAAKAAGDAVAFIVKGDLDAAQLQFTRASNLCWMACEASRWHRVSKRDLVGEGDGS